MTYATCLVRISRIKLPLGWLSGAPVQTHRTFKPEQMLIHGRQIGFIDFDEFCMVEPALDIAVLLAAIGEAFLDMKLHKIDHVGIIVNDLSAAKAFFLDPGRRVAGPDHWAE